MNKVTVSLVAVLMTSTLFATFSQTEARRVYNETAVSFQPAEQLPHFAFREVGEFVFIALEWKVEDNSNKERLNELRYSEKAIFHYLSSGQEKPSNVNSPFCSALTSWMIPDVSYHINNVPMCIVSENVENGVKRQVLALEKAPLIQERARVTAIYEKTQNRSDSDWLEELRRTQGHFKTPEERSKFFTLLGCPLVNIVEQGSLGTVLPAGEVGHQEMKDWMAYIYGEASFFSDYPRLSFAHYERVLFYPRWVQDKENCFGKAKSLIDAGQNTKKALNLLTTSISCDPFYADKWYYLGKALQASDRPKDALYAYLQSLRMTRGKSQSNAAVWKLIQSCCSDAGYTANAKGLAWYLQVSPHS